MLSGASHPHILRMQSRTEPDLPCVTGPPCFVLRAACTLVIHADPQLQPRPSDLALLPPPAVSIGICICPYVHPTPACSCLSSLSLCSALLCSHPALSLRTSGTPPYACACTVHSEHLQARRRPQCASHSRGVRVGARVPCTCTNCTHTHTRTLTLTSVIQPSLPRSQRQRQQQRAHARQPRPDPLPSPTDTDSLLSRYSEVPAPSSYVRSRARGFDFRLGNSGLGTED